MCNFDHDLQLLLDDVWREHAQATVRSQDQPVRRDELQGLLQAKTSFENALAESQRFISEKDDLISELEEKNSHLADILKASQDDKIKSDEELMSLKQDLENMEGNISSLVKEKEEAKSELLVLKETNSENCNPLF